jgi:hypothetical protein
MNRKQMTFWLAILLLYIELMIWCVIEGYFITIIKSFCILIGSFIIGCIYAKLGGNNDWRNKGNIR